jgi:hypothetical protein
MKKLAIVLSLMISGLSSWSQHTADLGVQLCAATYWGDIEKVDYSKSITPVAGILGRWNFNKRLAIRGQLLTGNLKANGLFSDANIAQSGTRSVTDEFARDTTQSYNFSRSIQSVEALLEFNFHNYKMGNVKKDWITPFVSLGVGGFYSRAPRVGTFILNPTETFAGSKLYTPYLDVNGRRTNNTDALSVIIPIGMGLKFNITKSLGGVIEVIVRKTFVDNIDNLDDPKRFQNFDNSTPTYSDKFAKGPLANNDWYATLSVSVLYQLWNSKGNCSIYDKIKK